MSDHGLEQLLIKLQPASVGDLKQLEDLLSRFVSHIVTQPCMEPVFLKAQKMKDGIRIEGWLCYPAQLPALQSLIALIPLKEIVLNVDLLPAIKPITEPDAQPPLPQESLPRIGDFRSSAVTSLFSTSRKMAVGHAHPNENSEVVHIWSVWDAIRPLYRQDSWTLCQTSNGYLGWVDDKDLALDEYPHAPRSLQTAHSLQMLSETALEYLGIPYLWGGAGSGGIDCSGLAAAVYERHGLVLPRDAHQQMLGGRIVATHDARLPLRTGDLLFFTHEDGRVGHVGISLGEEKVIHAEEPNVCLISMNPEDPDYDAHRARHFVVAKRYLL